MFSFISYLFSPVMKARSLMVETEKRKLETLESLLKDAIIAQDAHYKRQRAMNPARSSPGKISRRAMLDFRYDVVMERYFTNNTAGGERNGWNCGVWRCQNIKR